MTEQSSMHFYLNWAKERIDEMDAALASLEVKANQAKAEFQGKGRPVDRRSEKAARGISDLA